jgi:hypothetical protein
MRRVFGPRTVIEAAFLVAVPVVAAALGAGMWTIIAASAVAYLLIVVLEATLWREGRPAPALPRMRLPSRNVVVKRPEVEPVAPPAEPVGSVVVAHHAAPEPTPPEPAPPAPVVSQPEHVRVLRPQPPPEPEPTPEPEPVPEPVAERPPLAAVPEPPPEPPAPELVPEPAPVQTTVVQIGVGAGPREWNLWDLERLTREHSGPDPALDEERQFLLMYLREFADANGLLPVDFDGLVRDSFGELMGAR